MLPPAFFCTLSGAVVVLDIRLVQRQESGWREPRGGVCDYLLVEVKGTKWGVYNQVVAALRFLFREIVKSGEIVEDIRCAAEDRVGRHDRGQLHQGPPTQSLAFDGQNSPLVVCQQDAFLAQLFEQGLDLVFVLELDDLLLPVVNPTRENGEQQLLLLKHEPAVYAAVVMVEVNQQKIASMKSGWFGRMRDIRSLCNSKHSPHLSVGSIF